MCLAQEVKRGRNEGTVNIQPSNVAGNGNMTLRGTFEASLIKPKSQVQSAIFCNVGISEMMQCYVSTSIVNFKKLGMTEAHIQLTSPGNNGLRFFGVALSADLYLSTAMDTITGEAVSGRPDFHSYIRPSLICDQDWIAVNKKTNLKTYQAFTMADNADLLFLYEQISIKLGAECKMYKHSFFIDLGVGLYKEKKTDRYAGDRRFNQQKIWMEPGARFRIANRFSLLPSIKILLMQRVKINRPLPAQYLSLAVSFEAPVIFRETNTEAIRTLNFMDKEKEKAKDLITRNIEQRRTIKTDFEMSFEELAPGEDDDDMEKENLRKKEEIQKKMEEIEKMLEDLE